MDRFDAIVFVIFCAIVVVIFLGANSWARHIDKENCHGFGVASGRETKFVDYTFWSWDCLTPTTDGKKIPVKNLREIAP